MNIRDKVKLVDRSNLIKLGYDLSDIPEDVVYDIDYIYSSDIEHYYKKELVDNNLYSVEELKGFKVYRLSYSSSPITYNICVIDCEIKKVGSYVQSCSMTDKMLNDIINAYIVFGSNILDSSVYAFLDCSADNVSKIKNGTLSKKVILELIDDTHCLPCNDPLYDYMDTTSSDWLFDVNNEDFDLMAEIRNL